MNLGDNDVRHIARSSITNLSVTFLKVMSDTKHPALLGEELLSSSPKASMQFLPFSFFSKNAIDSHHDVDENRSRKVMRLRTIGSRDEGKRA
jgi:hypothetical protein